MSYNKPYSLKFMVSFLQENCSEFMYAAYLLDNARRIAYKTPLYYPYFHSKGCNWSSNGNCLITEDVLERLTPRQFSIFQTRFSKVFEAYKEVQENNKK